MPATNWGASLGKLRPLSHSWPSLGGLVTCCPWPENLCSLFHDWPGPNVPGWGSCSPFSMTGLPRKAMPWSATPGMLCPLFHAWPSIGWPGPGVPGLVICAPSSTTVLSRACQALGYEPEEAVPPLQGLASPQPTRPWGARTGKLCHLFHSWPSQVHPGPGAPGQGSYTPTSMANFSRPV